MIPWVPEDVFFVKILIVGGEALPGEELFSSHPSMISSAKHQFQEGLNGVVAFTVIGYNFGSFTAIG